MNIEFFKYHGTGNDFILLDNRSDTYSSLTDEQIAFLCDRHFGIGADGLIMLQDDDELDFKMRYFNSDGNEASMCGNGGRCIVAFSKMLGIVNDSVKFRATDGVHHARIISNEFVELAMLEVTDITNIFDSIYLDTGSPHYVSFTNNVNTVDVYKEGRKIRNNSELFPEGTNVNFVEVLNNNTIRVRTYERGVEDETLSCGTGVIASSIASFIKFPGFASKVNVETKGGNLSVSFNPSEGDSPNISFGNIYLSGPANLVFKGDINI